MTDTEQIPPQSTWLSYLKTTNDRVGIVFGSLGLAIGAISQFVTNLRDNAWTRWVAIGLLVIASVLFIRNYKKKKAAEDILRGLKSRVFVGARPLTENDFSTVGFFGRDSNLLSLTNELKDSRSRIIVLSGESGCGKTSLLQAGLVPRLSKDGCFPVHMFRVNNNLASQILPTIGPDKETKEPSSQQIVIVLDQFEDYFSPQTNQETVEAVEKLIRSSLESNPTHTKLIISIKRSCADDAMSLLHRLSAEQTHLTDLVLRVRLEFFSEQTARSVLNSYLASREGGLHWEPALIERVISDLAIEKREGSQPLSQRVIPPSELQMVCATLQDDNISSVKAYPGRKALRQRYISRIIEEGPYPSRAIKLVLTCLADVDNTGRAIAQSIDDICKKINIPDKKLIEGILQYLAERARLVNRISLHGSSQPQYELANETLLSVIKEIVGSELGRKSRVQAILEIHRLRSAVFREDRLSLGEHLILLTANSERISAVDREMIWNSIRSYLRILAIFVIVPIIGFIGKYYLVKTIAITDSAITVQYGFGRFKQEVENYPIEADKLDISFIGAALENCKVSLVKWHWNFFSSEIEKCLSIYAAQVILREESTYSYHSGSYTYATEVLIATGGIDEKVLASYRARILGLIDYASNICGKGTSEHQCASAMRHLGTLADIIAPALPSIDNHLLNSIKIKLREADRNSWQFRASLKSVLHLHYVDNEIRELINSSEPAVLSAATVISGMGRVFRERYDVLLIESNRQQLVRHLLTQTKDKGPIKHDSDFEHPLILAWLLPSLPDNSDQRRDGEQLLIDLFVKGDAIEQTKLFPLLHIAKLDHRDVIVQSVKESLQRWVTQDRKCCSELVFVSREIPIDEKITNRFRDNQPATYMLLSVMDYLDYGDDRLRDVLAELARLEIEHSESIWDKKLELPVRVAARSGVGLPQLLEGLKAHAGLLKSATDNARFEIIISAGRVWLQHGKPVSAGREESSIKSLLEEHKCTGSEEWECKPDGVNLILGNLNAASVSALIERKCIQYYPWTFAVTQIMNRAIKSAEMGNEIIRLIDVLNSDTAKRDMHYRHAVALAVTETIIVLRRQPDGNLILKQLAPLIDQKYTAASYSVRLELVNMIGFFRLLSRSIFPV